MNRWREHFPENAFLNFWISIEDFGRKGEWSEAGDPTPPTDAPRRVEDWIFVEAVHDCAGRGALLLNRVRNLTLKPLKT